jgi:hypothetical protein
MKIDTFLLLLLSQTVFRQYKKNMKAIEENGGTTPRRLVKVKHDPRVCVCVCLCVSVCVSMGILRHVVNETQEEDTCTLAIASPRSIH